MASSAPKIVKLAKTDDIETHLRVLTVKGSRFIELRDYVLSRAQYGRGYWVPEKSLDELIKALTALRSRG